MAYCSECAIQATELRIARKQLKAAEDEAARLREALDTIANKPFGSDQAVGIALQALAPEDSD